jgi:8-oxo-dGTP diphosphatase
VEGQKNRRVAGHDAKLLVRSGNLGAFLPSGSGPPGRANVAGMSTPAPPLPYKIATLVDLRDERGRVLLLRRAKAPNAGLCSPIGGKLEMATGESPAQCAQRETLEEAGLALPIERFRLLGIISEKAYEGRSHWLIFYYLVRGPVHVDERHTPDGHLEWFDLNQFETLPLPQTDREIIWPLVRRTEPDGAPVFSVHIDCAGPEMTWREE